MHWWDRFPWQNVFAARDNWFWSYHVTPPPSENFLVTFQLEVARNENRFWAILCHTPFPSHYTDSLYTIITNRQGSITYNNQPTGVFLKAHLGSVGLSFGTLVMPSHGSRHWGCRKIMEIAVIGNRIYPPVLTYVAIGNPLEIEILTERKHLSSLTNFYLSPHWLDIGFI